MQIFTFKKVDQRFLVNLVSKMETTAELREGVRDNKRLGRPRISTNDDIVEQVKKMILD